MSSFRWIDGRIEVVPWPKYERIRESLPEAQSFRGPPPRDKRERRLLARRGRRGRRGAISVESPKPFTYCQMPIREWVAHHIATPYGGVVWLYLESGYDVSDVHMDALARLWPELPMITRLMTYCEVE